MLCLTSMTIWYWRTIWYRRTVWYKYGSLEISCARWSCWRDKVSDNRCYLNSSMATLRSMLYSRPHYQLKAEEIKHRHGHTALLHALQPTGTRENQIRDRPHTKWPCYLKTSTVVHICRALLTRDINGAHNKASPH